MPKGRTKFQDSWLEKEWDGILIKEWLKSIEKDIYSARCCLCCEIFDISGSGCSQVRSHHKGKKHLLKFNAKFKSRPIFKSIEDHVRLQSDTTALSHQNQIVKAETLWALHVANGNSSFKSCNETFQLIKEMFPDSSIASAMQLKEKKVAYVLKHGIFPHFEKLLINDIADATKITLAFDESTNAQTKRQLDIYARYWSKEFDLVTCRYLKSVFLGHATADIILKELLDTVAAFHIPLSKIICLSMDNPNVNKGVLKKFSEQIGQDNSLLSIGTCNLHVANNAFKTFLNMLDMNFDEFANDVYFFLKNSAVRREDFQGMEEITHQTAHFLLRHVNSRWLSAGPVAQRLIEQWPNLCEYFLHFLPKQKLLAKQLAASNRYRRISSTLKDPSTKCFLAFITFTHKQFENFSLCFQSESPKIHLLFGEMNKLIRSVMMQFIKDDVVSMKEGTELRYVETENGDNWKKLISIEIGMLAKDFLSKLTQNEKKNFLLNARSALMKTVTYLKSNLPYSDYFFKDLEIFQPRATLHSPKCNSVHSLTRIARYLNFSDNFIDCAREEWKLFALDVATENKLSELYGTVRIDVYWKELFLIKDSCSRLKYGNLAILIKTVFVLPHGNSDPERGFSINRDMIDINHSDDTIVSLRLIKDTIKSYGGVLNVPITLPLLMAVKNSHQSFMEYTKRLKEEEEKLEKEKTQIMKEELEKEETRKRKIDLDFQISENNKRICELKRNKEFALGLITEGSARLTKAAVDKNAIEMTVSQKLITEGTEQLQKLEAELSVFESEEEKLMKKRLKMN